MPTRRLAPRSSLTPRCGMVPSQSFHTHSSYAANKLFDRFPSQDDDDETVDRTVSVELYRKLLSNPNLSESQREKLLQMQARREEREKTAQAELGDWLSRTASRQDLARNRRELEILQVHIRARARSTTHPASHAHSNCLGRRWMTRLQNRRRWCAPPAQRCVTKRMKWLG